MASDSGSLQTHRVAVIGAGIVGVVSALHLVRDGHQVTLIDRDDPGEGCSFGNAGLLARSSFVPMANASTFLSVPKWLLDPGGPLSIRWSYFPKLLPWLLKYIRSGLFDDLDARARALHVLTDPCVDLYRKLADEAGCGHLVRESDYLQVYRTESAFRKATGDMNIRRKLGMRIDNIDAATIRELEPTLSADYQYGYLIHDHAFVTDPSALVKRLADQFCREGGVIRTATVEDIKGGGTDVCRVVTSDGDLECDKVVLAAGAFSARLTAKTGVKLPMDTERGYHITCPNPGPTLSRPVMEGERKYLTTPMSMGLRFAGTVELGGLDAEPNPRRIDALTHHAKRMIDGLDTSNATTWMGFRPTLPDSLPVIGPSPDHPNIIYAFGHQHLGLTCAPKTAQLVTDLIAGRAPNVDIAPYSAGRFKP